MNYEERIKKFEQENAPFGLVDHENGRFSLCLSFLSEEYENYGQETFNAYAREIGEPVKDRYGWYTYGCGQEWELVFRKAFAADPRLSELEFDSEAGGFYCMAEDLSLLEEYGSTFRKIVEDPEAFQQLVIEALMEQYQERTVKEDTLRL